MIKKSIAILALLVPLAWGCQDRATQTAADNTARNERDREGNTLTAGDQPNNEADRVMTQRIRQAIVADNALSMNAKNVKVITINGVTTLRGPVNSEQEKNAVAAKAQQIAGAGKVINQLEVTQQ
jgi:osmotically-inducible protein OsmY